jgi:hypothetical protein
MAMGGNALAEQKFDAILRRMLQAKPLSRAEISAKIQARRKADKTGRAGKVANQSCNRKFSITRTSWGACGSEARIRQRAAFAPPHRAAVAARCGPFLLRRS